MTNALMWEVRAQDGRLDELVAWVREHAPAVLRAAGCADFGVYRSEQQRVVVIAHFTGEPATLPDPPAELVARPPHQWPFEKVA